MGSGMFAFSSDSKLLAAETGQGSVKLIDPESGREYARLEDPNRDIAWPCFSPDGTRLVTTNTSNTNSIHIWDLRAIRSRLTDMGLDWELPPYSPPDKNPNENVFHGVALSGTAFGSSPSELEVDRSPDPPSDSAAHHHAGPFTVTLDLGDLISIKQAIVHEQQAGSFTKSKQWAQAIQEYKRALELNPKKAR